LHRALFAATLSLQGCSDQVLLLSYAQHANYVQYRVPDRTQRRSNRKSKIENRKSKIENRNSNNAETYPAGQGAAPQSTSEGHSTAFVRTATKNDMLDTSTAGPTHSQ